MALEGQVFLQEGDQPSYQSRAIEDLEQEGKKCSQRHIYSFHQRRCAVSVLQTPLNEKVSDAVDKATLFTESI